MTLVYLSESGIQLWEAVGNIEAADFATLTLLGNSIGDVTSIWQKVVAHTRATLPRVLKWRTIGYSLAQSRTQENLALKKFSESLGPNDLVQKSLETGIIFSVQDVSEELHDIDLAALGQPTQTALIFLPPVREDLRPSLMDSLSRADQGLTAAKIRDFLQAHPDLVLCRAVESDTHFVVQFVGGGAAVKELLSVLKRLSVMRIQEKDVAAFING
jgi:hypothetical protein